MPTMKTYIGNVKGPQGESVTITSITESAEDGGSNVVTFSDGNTMNVKNGSQGPTGQVDYSRLEGYVKKSTISIDATSGDKAIALAAGNVNTEWRFVYASGITSLALSAAETFDNTAEAYYSIVFISGTTAATITNTLSAYFTGDDCVDGVFTPSASTTYDVGIWWNGITWQAIVRGV